MKKKAKDGECDLLKQVVEKEAAKKKSWIKKTPPKMKKKAKDGVVKKNSPDPTVNRRRWTRLQIK